MWILWWLAIAVGLFAFCWGVLRVLDGVGMNGDEQSAADFEKAQAAFRRRQQRERAERGRNRVIYLHPDEEEL